MERKPSGVVTLTSDFGLSDHFVGVMKGVMLGINPALHFVDISHDIPPQDILAGSFCLRSAYGYFPPGTIHLGVVDPGVGGSRRVLVAMTRDHLFVGPDNGLFSFVFSDPAFRRAHAVTASGYFLVPRGATFHGRDIFAPVAAWLSRGIPPDQMGPRIDDAVRISLPEPHREGAFLEGEIIHVDRFGNLISNITESLCEGLKEGREDCRLRISVSSQEIERVVRYYDEGFADKPLALFNSSGLLEIFCRGSGAAGRLGVGKGERIRVRAT